VVEGESGRGEVDDGGEASEVVRESVVCLVLDGLGVKWKEVEREAMSKALWDIAE
jgi:hypothetical protein